MKIKIYKNLLIEELQADVGVMIKYINVKTPHYYDSKKYSEIIINIDNIEHFAIVKNKEEITQFIEH